MTTRYSFHTSFVAFTLAAILVGAAPRTARAELVVGGFDAARGGQASFVSGSFFDMARQACQQDFDDVTFTSSPTLTSEFLATVDVLVVSAITGNNSRITALSTEEASALSSFVNGGGALLALMDNSGFAATGIATTFGLLDTGFLGGPTTSSIVDTGSPIATGPFGMVGGFSQAWPGYFDVVPPTCAVVAVNPLGASLATIEPDAFGAGSGPCAFYSDNQTFIDDGEIPGAEFSVNATLFLNTFAFLAPQDPNASDPTSWGRIKAAFR